MPSECVLPADLIGCHKDTEAHERLAELEEKLPVAVNEQTGNGERDEMDLLGDHEENLAERLSKMVIENELEDPAIMRAVQTRPVLQPQPGSLNSSIWDGSEVLRRIRGPLLAQEMPTVSVLEYALPQRPPQGPEDDRDLSERALPRRSTSPIIGSPPVRAVPIGTPPKQMAVPSFTQQILCPKPVHVRPPIPPRYPAPYGERMSPNQLCSVPNSSLLGHPFPPSVPPVLSPLQRAQLLGGAQLQPGRMSPSQFARVPGFVGSPLAAMNPKLLQGRVGQMLPPAPGFRAFFSAPPSATPPPQQHPPGPGPHLQNLRSQAPMFRPDTTHLHPQHRRLLYQRQQQNRNQHRNLNGAGDRGSHRSSHQDHLRKDPYANLMLQREKDWVSKIQMMQLQSTDPYLDDFYYQNYFEKLEKLSAAEEIQGDGPKKERTKLITPQVAKLEHAYKPVQFEGSLGKLTVSSVNNPRKMIDAVVTSRSEDDETKEKQVRDKRRKTLVIIEKTYSLLLDVEDYERRYLLSLEEERPALMDERKHKICSMYDNLRGKLPGQERPSDDHFVQIMCAAMLTESLLSPPLSSSISDYHQPFATANEPTSKCSYTSTLQSSPHCCAPEQAVASSSLFLMVQDGCGIQDSALHQEGQMDFGGQKGVDQLSIFLIETFSRSSNQKLLLTVNSQDIVTWPHLSAEKAGKYLLVYAIVMTHKSSDNG
ncbi:hypothetical protein H8958_009112 [Nasalis larvatus]